MKNKSFAIFIITHGRADQVITINTLNRLNYTGRTFLIIDNEDDQAELYHKNFGKDRVFMFDKKAIADQTDEGDNFNDRRTTTHARNACFQIAKKIGVKYFMVLDDDYTTFSYRIDQDGKYNTGGGVVIKNINQCIDALIGFYEKINAKTIAIAQGGDFIGGAESTMAKVFPLKRKAMNSFLCSVDRPFKFIGRLNEDVNTYVRLGNTGDLFFTIPFMSLTQKTTQLTKGGMTEAYLKYGTYVKSFYTVMYAPSAVKLALMGNNDKRIHHKIKWKNCVPCIISEELKKNKTPF